MNDLAEELKILLIDTLVLEEIKPGDIVIFVAFGAGLTWGANVIQF